MNSRAAVGECVVVEQAGLRVGAVAALVEHLAGDVGPEAVGEVPARVQRHAQQPLVAQLGAQLLPVRLGEVVDVLDARLGQARRLDAGGQDGPVRDEVGVDARVRLHVGVGRAEQLAGVLGGHGLDGVDVLAAGVEPVPDGALRVLVREPAAHGEQRRRRRVVLAGDQLERIPLVGKLFARRRRDARLDGLDDLQDRAVGGACGIGVLGTGGGGGGHGRVCGHAVQPTSRSDDGISGSSSSRAEPFGEADAVGPGLQPAAQQPVSLDVGAGVGPPQRRGQEPQHLPGALVVDQQPALEEGDHVVDVAVLVVQHQRGVLADVGQRRRRFGHRLGALAVEPQPEVGVDLAGPAAPARPDRGVQRQVRQPLGHQALRRVDQEDGLLGPGPCPRPARPPCGSARCGGRDRTRARPAGAGWTSAA